MKIYKALLLTAAILLFLATLAALSLPYGFFTFLRIIVCGVAVYAAIQVRDSVVALIGLLMVAFLFNPLVPIHLPQQIWRIIDLATAAAFIRLAFKPSKRQNQQEF
ncbi:hypothetical protein GCM10028803_33000 [Larkinella knui]|uniref:Uncharacterized protein n=1 Tax=Larkinella knui TaxID=2025310 RepID=A0A3P1CXZ2_9BACT|nr:DUF6804 family protein [Larkinella knui]RRB18312.1 hypothetical protein EHT87_08580 [Larkinella knui]